MSEQDNLESKQKALTEEIVNMIASNETFRKEIVDDPAGALTKAGFAERLEELSSDVTGYAQANANHALFAAFAGAVLGGRSAMGASSANAASAMRAASAVSASAAAEAAASAQKNAVEKNAGNSEVNASFRF